MRFLDLIEEYYREVILFVGRKDFRDPTVTPADHALPLCKRNPVVPLDTALVEQRLDVVTGAAGWGAQELAELRDALDGVDEAKRRLREKASEVLGTQDEAS